ncbi:dihydropteroate synthase [Zunongwangia endophytica]|uniref:dihydropteroate synthase n=1 Tax=Zunongwangia endophytica TaxID=1808945 RepID=A0ABV8HE90_9FLAO|nr:dihydropteroate synthase [Zunongwangia endophytica]MDN3596788.1 dihydropteroate synthase [Zunongwangia endophytica]
MTINCKGKLIDLSTPKVMGILNTTPDSFFENSRTQNETELLRKAEIMLRQGATFIDIGGYSSRPDANDVSETEELQRVIPAIEVLIKHFPEILISVDTFRSKVAAEAIESGAAIINDIAAGNLDDKMMHVIAQYQVPYIMMHMRGTPKTMKQLTDYEDLVTDITFYFSEKIKQARALEINDLILDPGFGFAKTIDQNFELLKKSDLFTPFDLPLLIGISRKTMIHKTLDIQPTEALNGTSILNTLALTKGASILRVHDVKEAMECIKLVAHFNK